jgi:hypothetical protein
MSENGGELDNMDETDGTIERIAARLRTLPAVDSAAKARVLVAVAAERERDRERERARHGRRRLVRWAGGATLAAAGVFAAFLIGQDRGANLAANRQPQADSSTVSAPAAGPAATLAARSTDEAALVPVQLVFHAPAASRVSVVGDFTGWEPTTEMTRDPASGLWSVALRVPVGRHVYAFLVDDSLWVRDPRAPAAPDADFGRPGSVMLVGRP